MKYAILIFSTLALTVAAAAVTHARPVYLRDGGVIQAKSVWRTKGMVHVLVNRDSLVAFHNSEIDLKRTFPVRKKKPATPKQARQPQTAPQGQPSAPAAPEQAQPEQKKGFSLPSFSLPQKTPPTLGSGNEEGAIRKQKREMSERLGE